MAEIAVGRRASVVAPATSANLGPGFDALGLALALRDEVDVEVVESGVFVEVEGEGAETVARDESNLVVRAMRFGFEALGADAPGIRLACRNRIPHGRGMGSSAAAIVAGLRLAVSLADSPAAESDLLPLAADIEGHPDNVAACLLGSLTIAYSTAGEPHGVRLDVHPAVSPVVFVPPGPVSTEVARGLLPDTVSHRDAAANSGRTALLVAALTTSPELLLDATEDRLHQSYREPAMPESIALIEGLRADGHAAVVSGAGPSVLVFDLAPGSMEEAAWTPSGWRALRLDVDPSGAVVRS